ncbi:zinc metalloproteinase nas-13-like [Schistocerca piceifrons]|uniref:zinc metalloproteinase nas-13-like n=1 Tax=Schistocerca piceifrons TaxID=274613 RepID=UPI001F5F246A|nr:zinc metalloproteinase nas-13-like [Schistocerca piceifrons]
MSPAAGDETFEPKGCIHHEIMHAIGFGHEHNAPSRDKYIRINWSNVKDGQKEYFTKLKPEDVTDYGVEYDYYSIMHASRKAFSKNNRSTIETIDEFAVIGQRQKLSKADIVKVNRHYKCA